MKHLVSLSGGLDSATLLAQLLEIASPTQVRAIGFDYGQSHEIELHAAEQLARHYDVAFEVVPIPRHIFEGSKSTLIVGGEQPKFSYAELREQVGPSPTYVPFRNGLFLSILTSMALKYEKSSVWIAVHADDAHNWAYPDCTPGFIHAMSSAIWTGTYGKVNLMAPFMLMSKAEIVRVGVGLCVPYGMTWSCYSGGPLACGTCPTCVSRLEAFNQVGVVDPIVYQEAE